MFDVALQIHALVLRTTLFEISSRHAGGNLERTRG